MRTCASLVAITLLAGCFGYPIPIPIGSATLIVVQETLWVNSSIPGEGGAFTIDFGPSCAPAKYERDPSRVWFGRDLFDGGSDGVFIHEVKLGAGSTASVSFVGGGMRANLFKAALPDSPNTEVSGSVSSAVEGGPSLASHGATSKGWTLDGQPFEKGFKTTVRHEYNHTVQGTTYWITEVATIEHLGEVPFYFLGNPGACGRS